MKSRPWKKNHIFKGQNYGRDYQERRIMSSKERTTTVIHKDYKTDTTKGRITAMIHKDHKTDTTKGRTTAVIHKNHKSDTTKGWITVVKVDKLDAVIFLTFH